MIMGLAIVLAGVLLCEGFAAQAPMIMPNGSDLPFTDVYQAAFGSRDLAFRLSYDTERYGQDNGQFGIGVQGHRPIQRGVLLYSGQYNIDFGDAERMGFDVGGGFRVLHQDIFGTGRTRVFGATLWYDGLETDIDNYFNQMGFSLESLGDRWDIRCNGNFPIGTQTQPGEPIPTGELGYWHEYLTEITRIPIDEAIAVVDFEVARRIGDYDAWIFAGGYGMDASGDDDFGGKVGLRGYLGNDAQLELSVTDDDFFDTRVNFALIWYPGRSGLFGRRSRCINDRLREPVLRNDYIATRRVYERGDNPLHDENGDPIGVVHVNSNATAPGDGSYEDPYTSLDDVHGGSKNGDIVLVWSASQHTGESVLLRDLQRLLGEGNDIEHKVVTEELGEVTLPETRVGAASGAKPVITDAPGAAVTLATAQTTVNVEADDFDPTKPISYNEVSNLSIDGGGVTTNGIVSPVVGIGEVNINFTDIADTTGNGIELTPFVLTYEDDDGNSLGKQVFFNPTIKQATFNSVRGNDICLNADSGEPDTTPVNENILIQSVTSTNAYGWGISIANNTSAALIDSFDFTASANSDGGIKFDTSPGGATVTRSDITGGAGMTGKGVYLLGATGDSFSPTFNFTDVTVTNMGGTGLHVRGDATNVDFTGKITQTANDAAAVLVEGDGDGAHTGELTFNEMVLDEGVVTASIGTGLQFLNADGTYTFNDLVSVSGSAGATAGINIAKDATTLDGSDGTFTFSKVALTDIDGTAFNINGGTADVSVIGLITQDVNPQAAVSITDHSLGTVDFSEWRSDSGIITAATGSGLVFTDANGVYNFNNRIDLDDVSTGISITNNEADSGGLFTFSNVTIDDATDAAFRIDGGASAVTFNGKITQAGATAVDILGGHKGIVTFNERVSDQGIVTVTGGDGLQFASADGTYDFNHKIDVSGTATAGINIEDNSDGTFNFDNVAITNISGTAFDVDGGTAEVTLAGLITQTANAQAAVNIEGGHTGTVTFSEKSPSAGVVMASQGSGLQFSNAAGTYDFNHKINISGTATAGINIAGDSHGTFRFDDVEITNISGTAFDLDGGTAGVTLVGLITQTTKDEIAVDISGGHTGLVVFSEKESNAGIITASDGDGLQFENADGVYTFSDKILLGDETGAATTTARISIGKDGTNVSDGTFNFSDVEIYNATTATGKAAFAIDGGTANVTFVGKITQDLAAVTTNNSAAVEVKDGHTGVVTFSEKDSNVGIIEATEGAGLQFTNADGTYTFNHKIDVSGNATAGINIDEQGGLGSDGTFTFNDVTITDIDAVAFDLNGGSANVNFTGLITQTNVGAVAAVRVTGSHSGTVNFSEKEPDQGIIEATHGDGLTFTNANGTYNFNHGIELGDNAALTTAAIEIVDSDGAFTFSDVAINDVANAADAAFSVDGGTANVNLTGKITQDRSGAELAVYVTGGHTGTVTFNEKGTNEGVVTATEGNGLLFEDADGLYTFNHEILLGDESGANTTTARISIGKDISNNTSDGTFIFNDVAIHNATTAAANAALEIDGGLANVNFTGKITQDHASVASAAVEVKGGHTGTVNLNEKDTDQGVVAASEGRGLLFTNADGTYNFNHKVTLGDMTAVNTTTAVVSIGSVSDGTFNFDDIEIANTITSAFVVDGGKADVNFTGKITQELAGVPAAAAAVEITGGHQGTITFNELETNEGVVEATRGNGLQFNNADGTYDFNHEIDISGANAAAGISITNSSDGTFNFDYATITDIDAVAFNLNGGTAQVNFIGKITQNTYNQAVVSIGGGHQAGTQADEGNGIVTFQEKGANTGVIEATDGTGLVFKNAGGTYNFDDKVLLGTDDGATLTTAQINIGKDGGAASDGTFGFDDVEIFNTSVSAFELDGGEANVNFEGKITQEAAGAGLAVEIEGAHVGSVTFDEAQSGEGIITAIQGDGLWFNNADGTYNFNDKIDLSGDAVIDVDLDQTESDHGNLSFNGTVAINSGANDAVTISGDDVDASIRFTTLDIDTTTGTGLIATSGTIEVTNSSSTINTTSGTAIDLDGSANGLEIGLLGMTFAEVSADGNAAAANGIVLDTITGNGTLRINGGTIENTTGHRISITDAANVSLNNMTLNGSGDEGIHVEQDESFTLVVNNCNVNTGDNVGINMTINDDATTSRITLRDNVVAVDDAEAVKLYIPSNSNNKTVYFLMEDNDLSNASTTGYAVADLDAHGKVTLNATVHDNTFTAGNVATATAYTTTSNNNDTKIRLSLKGNTLTSSGTNIVLDGTTGTFTVEDVTDITADNNGATETHVGCTNDAGGIPTP